MPAVRLAAPLVALFVGASILPAQPAPRLAFVSSAFGPGDFSLWTAADPGTVGVEAADSICRNLAAAASLPNATGFRAWLSDGQDDAWCRVQGLTGTRDSSCNGTTELPGGGPWARPGAGRWAGPLASLTGATGPLVPLDRDENGQLLAEWTAYWTGTDEWGRAIAGAPGPDCGGWTSSQTSMSGSQGSAGATRVRWTAEFLTSCANHHRIVCLETGPAGALPPVASLGPAALAFVTDTTGGAEIGGWPGAESFVGLDAADQICRGEAAAARLPRPESFVAWLSTSTVDARDRLPAAIGWARLDGVGVATGRADLVDGRLAAPLNLTPSRAYLPAGVDDAVLAWTGTAPDGTAVSQLSCGDWTSTEEVGLGGELAIASAAWTDGRPADCSEALPLLCFSTVEMLFWDPFESGDLERWSTVQF